jgi:hypothetical protein
MSSPLQLFQSNLHSLSKRYPTVAEKIQKQSISQFHSTLDPSRVTEWLRKTYDSTQSQVLLLGLAHGFAVQHIYQEQKPTILVIVEHDIQNLINTMQVVDLRLVFEDNSVFWIIACHPQNLDDQLHSVRTMLAANGFQTIKVPTENSHTEKYNQSILKMLPTIIEHENFNLKARLARGNLTQMNLILNFESILNSSPVDKIFQRFSRHPAIIVAAGPSLDKNSQFLHEVKNRALIIAVDTALKPLQKIHVIPDYAVTCDPTEANAKHFDSIELHSDCMFVFAPDCYHKNLQQFKDHSKRVCLYDNSSYLFVYLAEKLGFKRLVERPLHVTESAIQLALAMDCDPVIFVGFDLSFPSDCITTHASQAARSCDIMSINNNQAKIRTESGEEKQFSFIEVPGVDGTPVHTIYSFKQYLDNLKTIIRRNPRQWIDATEGGAMKEGCEIQTFERVLKSLPDRKVPILNVVPSAQFDRSSLLTDISQKFEIVQQSLKTLGDTPLKWKEALASPDIRIFFEHAIFPFQLLPPIHKVENANQFLKEHSRNVMNTVSPFIQLWEKTLSKLK